MIKYCYTYYNIYREKNYEIYRMYNNIKNDRLSFIN